MTTPQEQVEALRDKVSSGERGGSDVDRDLLIDFSNELKLLREQYGWLRHRKLLRMNTRMSENVDGIDLADCLEDRDATETLVRWIHDTYDLHDKPDTNRDYRVAVRVLGRRVTDDGVEGPETPPESIAWVTTEMANDYDPSPDQADMLTWEEDIQPMLDACMNPRDRCAIALQFDAGLRGGELQDLRVGSITDTEIGLAIGVDGKQGQRSVDLIPSTPHVNDWLSKHPGGDDDDPMWCHLNSPEPLSYRSYLKMFKEPAKRAGIDKEATPTNFRRSNLAWLARQGMNARYIEKRQGRKPGSDSVANYVAIFDEDVGNEYARLMGIEVKDDEEQQDLAPLECPRCGKSTPRDEDRCVWCNQAMKVDASKQDKDTRLEIAEVLADADGETAEQMKKIMQLFEEHPQLREVFNDDR